MPIYEYRCDTCSTRFERLSSFAERDIRQACPSCESPQTHVLVSSFAAIGGDASEMSDMTASAGAGCCGGGCGCGCSVN